ncbi:OsmC family protein [Luteibacter yeojuensis]|uniref:OsmC family protein n=1 Tax=Luteibacter yeojuensis TaxID=345309 RepID=A0A7X5QWH7_9GAMM|nr:OsmC family protein [Luteibacter yeojuensis]NID16704.1 OsmC family protein [Luteibacter yeojuensis]
MASNPVVVEETGQGTFQVRAHGQGPSFFIDEPLDLGGLASGPTPYDLLSAALGACTVMTIRMYARRKGLPLAHAQASVTHRRDEVTSRDIFERHVFMDGDLTQAQRDRLLAVAEACPVSKTLHAGAEIVTRLAPQAMPVVDDRPCDRTHPKAMDESCRQVDPTAVA